MAFTDQAIMEQIQNVMIETPDGGQTWGSGLWSMDEVVSYMNQRQLQFLKNTQLQFGISLIAATQGVSTYDLPDDWITTVRVLFIYPDGSTIELANSDTWEADNGIPDWSYEEGQPKLYYDGGKPASLEIMPLPDDDGTIQIHYVPYSALLTGDGEIFTVPDEFVVPIKYGVLSDMLTKVARAQDPSRAKYCADRYQMGIEFARLLVGGFQ